MSYWGLSCRPKGCNDLQCPTICNKLCSPLKPLANPRFRNITYDIPERWCISNVVLNTFFERIFRKLRHWEKRRICPDRMGRLRDRVRIKFCRILIIFSTLISGYTSHPAILDLSILNRYLGKSISYATSHSQLRQQLFQWSIECIARRATSSRTFR